MSKKSRQIKKLVEIAKGVFRDPTQIYISAKTGQFIKYGADYAKEKLQSKR